MHNTLKLNVSFFVNFVNELVKNLQIAIVRLFRLLSIYFMSMDETSLRLYAFWCTQNFIQNSYTLAFLKLIWRLRRAFNDRLFHFRLKVKGNILQHIKKHQNAPKLFFDFGHKIMGDKPTTWGEMSWVLTRMYYKTIIRNSKTPHRNQFILFNLLLKHITNQLWINKNYFSILIDELKLLRWPLNTQVFILSWWRRIAFIVESFRIFHIHLKLLPNSFCKHWSDSIIPLWWISWIKFSIHSIQKGRFALWNSTTPNISFIRWDTIH